MARAVMRSVVQDPAGNALLGRTIQVCQFGTTTPVTIPIYADHVSTVVIPPTLTTDPVDGTFEVWADSPGVRTTVVDLATGDSMTCDFEADPSDIGQLQATAADHETRLGANAADDALYHGVLADRLHPAELPPWSLSALGTPAQQRASIQAAIDACVARGGGTVTLKPGRYQLDQGLVMRKGVWLIGTTSDDGPAITGTGNEAVVIEWYGPPNGTMLVVQSSTPGNVVTGGGIDGIVLDGRQLAATGICLSSVQFFSIPWLRCRSFRGQGLRMDDANSVNMADANPANRVPAMSLRNHIGTYEWVWGFNTADAGGTPGSYGLVMDGSAGAGCTLNYIEHIFGSRYNGYTLYLGWADNNYFGRVASSDGTNQGTGGGVMLSQGITYFGTVLAAYDNTFGHITDSIVVNAPSGGHRVLRHTNEGARINAAPGATIFYDATDWICHDRWASHAYLMQEPRLVDVGGLSPLGSVAVAASVTGLPLWRLPPGQTGGVGAVLAPSVWSNGTISKIRVYYSVDTTVGAGSWLARLTYALTKPTAAGGTLAAAAPVDVAPSCAKGAFNVTYADFTVSIQYQRNSLLSFSVQRMSTDASYPGNVQIHGVRVFYKSLGPWHAPAAYVDGDLGQGPGYANAGTSQHWQYDPHGPDVLTQSDGGYEP